jgi:hypothetical protein
VGDRIPPDIHLIQSLSANCIALAQRKDVAPEIQAETVKVAPEVTRIGISHIEFPIQ